MKLFRKCFTIILVLAMIGGINISALAATNNFSLEETQVIDVASTEVEVSDKMTFKEAVKEFAKNEGVSEKKAEMIFLQNERSKNIVKNNASDKELIMMASSSTYRTISTTLTVTSQYKPSLRFYCQTSEGGGFWGIVEIINVQMNRSYNGISKQFGGSVYTKLENAGKIKWTVNGDFFNNGTTTVNGGVSIGIGEAASVNFGVSGSTNFFKYYYKEGYYIVR